MESNFKEEVAGAATKYCIAKLAECQSVIARYNVGKKMFSRLSINCGSVR